MERERLVEDVMDGRSIDPNFQAGKRGRERMKRGSNSKSGVKISSSNQPFVDWLTGSNSMTMVQSSFRSFTLSLSLLSLRLSLSLFPPHQRVNNNGYNWKAERNQERLYQEAIQ